MQLLCPTWTRLRGTSCQGSLGAALWGGAATCVRKAGVGAGLKGTGCWEECVEGPQAATSSRLPFTPALPPGRSAQRLFCPRLRPAGLACALKRQQPRVRQGGRLLSRDTEESGCGLKLLSLPPPRTSALSQRPDVDGHVFPESIPDGQRARLRMAPAASCLWALPSPVAVLRAPGSQSLFVLGRDRVLQETAVQAVFRNEVLHVLDFQGGLCSWGRLWGQWVPACAHQLPPPLAGP